MKRILLQLVALFLLAGCSKTDQWQATLADSKATMQGKGWAYFETLGEPGAWAGDFWNDSPTASSIGVSWIVDGKQEEKKYYQTNYLYYVHNYIKPNGDAFVMVYRKEKALH